MTSRTRRQFLASAAAAGGTLASGRRASAADEAPAPEPFAAPPLETVRWGFIGLGARGGSNLRHVLRLEGVEVVALCDPHRPSLEQVAQRVREAGRPAPAIYADGDEDFRRLVERDDLDAVIVSTPWRWHAEMALAAMRAGKHAFVEVPLAVTVEECRELVAEARRSKRHCSLLENACYGRDELMALRLCEEGVLGELLHSECAYLHDVRAKMHQVEHGSGSWQIPEYAERDGSLYTTHGIGPVARCLGIHRGDRFASLVSTSSPALGLATYAREHFPPDHVRNRTRYRCGDVNVTTLRTARGRTVVVTFSPSTPRPYSRVNLLQGTAGIFQGFPQRIFVEESVGESASRKAEWETDLDPWRERYEHPLWTAASEALDAALVRGGIAATGHGGMDHAMFWRIVQCLHEGLPMDIDVYDGAAWSAVAPLSERSVADGGAPVEIPDFTAPS